MMNGDIQITVGYRLNNKNRPYWEAQAFTTRSENIYQSTFISMSATGATRAALNDILEKLSKAGYGWRGC